MISKATIIGSLNIPIQAKFLLLFVQEVVKEERWNQFTRPRRIWTRKALPDEHPKMSFPAVNTRLCTFKSTCQKEKKVEAA